MAFWSFLKIVIGKIRIFCRQNNGNKEVAPYVQNKTIKRKIMNTTNKVDCPICKGKGKINLPKQWSKNWIQIKREMGKTLLRHGYSHRQVQKFFGYKSVRSTEYK